MVHDTLLCQGCMRVLLAGRRIGNRGQFMKRGVSKELENSGRSSITVDVPLQCRLPAIVLVKSLGTYGTKQ